MKIQKIHNFLSNTYKKFKKQNKYIKTFAHLLIISTILILLIIPNGCKNSYSNLLSYSVQRIPKNLDPQTAYDSDEISIIKNVFEGLYKQNPNNTYSLAAANSVQFNENKTKALFSIKTNRVWFLNSNDKTEKQTFEQPFSANDFEFAFKRLFNPLTNSPFAHNYYFIKNSQQIHEGKLNMENLGVKANGNQLLIELEHPVPNFEELLAAAPAMPCNEKFFNHTKGRYGLNIHSIMCNGKFYVHQWPQNQNKKLRLRPNSKNPESKNIKILGVNLSQRTQQEALKLIKKNEIDSAFFDNTEIELGNIGLNNTIEFQNSTSGIIFNQNSSLFKNEKIRQALALTIDRNKIENNLTSKKTTIAKNIVPQSVTIAGENFQNLKPSNSLCPEPNIEKAKKLFAEGISELKPKPKNKKEKNKKTELNLNQFSIMVNKNQYAIINEILQNWQQNLNIYLKTEICDNETYLNNLKNKNFDCALITLENEFNSPNCMLSKFLPDSKFNCANVQIPSLKLILNDAAKSTTINEAAQKYVEAEQEILNSASFIPIYHSKKTFAYNKKFNNISLTKSCKQLLFDYTTPSK